jgi:integrase
MSKKKTVRRRVKGEGTLYYDAKRKRWRGGITIGYDAAGNQIRRSVSRRTQAEALMALDELKRTHADGRLSLVDISVSSYLEEWLSEKTRGVSARTAELYREQVDRYVNPRIGRVKLEKVGPGHIQRAIGNIADTAGIPTANKVRRLLLQAFAKAVQWRYLADNPCEAVDPLKEPRVEWTLWTPDQVRTFLDHVADHRLYAAFYLLVGTGLRRGELLGLQWEDLSGNQLRIQRSYTILGGRPAWSEPKTQSGRRTVTLADDVMERLKVHRVLQLQEGSQAQPGEPNVIFSRPDGRPISPQTFYKMWTRLQDEAGLPRIRIHDLRHLHISLLVQLGFDPRVIADRVGHSDPGFTLDRYSHSFAARREAAAVNLDVLLGDSGPLLGDSGPIAPVQQVPS